jgi:energy-coupling factor transporter ATP-binding protein EcfA2
MAFCSIIGAKGVGKTSLLNVMLGLNPERQVGLGSMKFTLEHGGNVEGLWVWSVPVYNDFQRTNIFFMDAVDVEPNNPGFTQYSTVLTLLSSVTIIMQKGGLSLDGAQILAECSKVLSDSEKSRYIVDNE